MPDRPLDNSRASAARATPKDFFLWAGAMICLYASAIAFISLIFSYLNYAFPDALAYYVADPYQGGVSYEMATLIVLFPLYLILSRLIVRDIERDPSREGVWVRRWALYLTLFIAGATIAGDLVTLLMYFFNGDITLRFILKVAVLLLGAGAVFLHFLADLGGYWRRERAKASLLWSASGVLVALTIVAGFFVVGTPWQARLYRLDEQKVSDLQVIQSQIVSYWQTQGALPQNLSALNDTISGYRTPVDPQTGATYEYSLTGQTAFQLCATFNEPSRPGMMSASIPPSYPASVGVSLEDNWTHGQGRACFSRTIDPNRYPVRPEAMPAVKSSVMIPAQGVGGQ